MSEEKDSMDFSLRFPNDYYLHVAQKIDWVEFQVICVHTGKHFACVSLEAQDALAFAEAIESATRWKSSPLKFSKTELFHTKWVATWALRVSTAEGGWVYLDVYQYTFFVPREDCVRVASSVTEMALRIMEKDLAPEIAAGGL